MNKLEVMSFYLIFGETKNVRKKIVNLSKFEDLKTNEK